MSVTTSRAKIHTAAKELRIQWNETKLRWRDENSRKFEEDHLTPMLSRVRTAESAMEHMIAVLQRIHRDCE